MTASAKSKRTILRMVLAMAIAPAVPILALALAYWKGTGDARWIPIFFVLGYLFFLVLGVPVTAMLMKTRRLLNCTLSGGVVTIAPIVLLSLMSMSSSTRGFSGETWLNYLLLTLAGCLGGALFWLIAFARSTAPLLKQKKPPATPASR